MQAERLKLVFPRGEHPQVELGQGMNRVGRDSAAAVNIDRPGLRPQHCDLFVNEFGVMLQVAEGAAVQVNGRLVEGMIALRPGDILGFGEVQARLVPTAVPHMGAVANDDVGATAVRPTLPRYVLRVVAGESFGRSYAVTAQTVLGRAAECGLCFDHAGLSRRHAKLVPTEEGLAIEDLRSTNGSFINGRRVQRGTAKPGDEVGFDTLRFRLLAPGQIDSTPEAPRPTEDAEPASATGLWIAVAAIAVAVGAVAWWLLG